MEVFSNLMEDYVRMNTDFQFHHRCAKLRLSHLCFADDFLIFSDASLKSVNVIQQVLKEFECLSRLKANPSKSSIFFAGVSRRIKHLLLSAMQMQEGVLHVRYLGVHELYCRLPSFDYENHELY
jgi:hypothetical protein